MLEVILQASQTSTLNFYKRQLKLLTRRDTRGR